MPTREEFKNHFKKYDKEYLIFFILLLCLIVACVWIVIIHTAFKLHEAKTVGKAKESVCGEFYLEGESARESIYEAYTSEDGGVEKILKTLLELLVVLMGILMILVLIYGGFFLRNNGDDLGWNFIGSVEKDYRFKLFFNLFLITTIILWFVYYYKSPQDATINPFSDVLFRAGQTFSEEEKSKLIGRQSGFIIAFGILLCLLGLLFNSYSIWEDHRSIYMTMFVLFLILAIFIPFLSSEVYTLNSKVRAYYSQKVAGTDSASSTDTASVNANIRANLSNELFNNNLRNNIRSLHGLSEIPATLQDNEQNPYLYKLYRYVLNGVNMAEIRNIVIPEELTEYIDPVYLRGENIIVLKYDFLRFYNSTPNTLGTNFNTYVKKYLKQEYKDKVNVSLSSTTLQCEAPIPCEPNSTTCKYDYIKCDTVIKAVTKYILENDSYKLNNIVPVSIRSKLQNLRTNTQMEDTVQSYFTTINSLSITLFVVVTYLLFHNYYLQNTEYVLARTSIVMLGLLILIGLIGWLFKDLWL